MMDEVPPDDDTEPPTILILSPDNGTAHATNNVVLSLNVSVRYSGTAKALFFWEIYHKTDCQAFLNLEIGWRLAVLLGEQTVLS
jgi:hypothetical protein